MNKKAHTFIYIEVSGTEGGAFRLMYAQFLRESSSLLDEPRLNEVADLFEKSGRMWSRIAASMRKTGAKMWMKKPNHRYQRTQ